MPKPSSSTQSRKPSVDVRLRDPIDFAFALRLLLLLDDDRDQVVDLNFADRRHLHVEPRVVLQRQRLRPALGPGRGSHVARTPHSATTPQRNNREQESTARTNFIGP